jgi:hypothetical protein
VGFNKGMKNYRGFAAYMCLKGLFYSPLVAEGV